MPARAVIDRLSKKNTDGFLELSECFALDEAMDGMTVDDANGVLRGVVLLTGNKTSANKTHYTPKALAEAADRYQGAKMFIDHRVDNRGNRSIHDFGGVYKNVRLDGDKLRADLHLLENKRSLVMPIAKMRPDGIGLSIKDKGHGVEKDGVFFVEGFAPKDKTKFSIDFVDEPSVNKDLFESAIQTEEEDEMDFKTLTVETLQKERPDLIESAQNAGKAAILKELEEARVSGKKSDAMAAKLTALIEAEFPKDVVESVKKMILPDDISLDTAKAIITGQKALIESLKKTTTTTGKPHVEGMGQRKEEAVTEAAKGDLPSDDDFASAFRR